MNDIVDIIVPVWNGEKYIEFFISKLLEQTYQNFIIYFVYDESQDNTLKILEKYQKKLEEKIVILHSPVKCGQGAARDLAVDSGMINGDYVIFLDADDYPEKDFLETMIYNAKKYDVDMVMCGFDCFDDESGKVVSVQMIHNKKVLITDISEYKEIAYVNPAVWNKLYRREVIEQVRFGRAKSMEDGIYIAKVLPYIKSIKIINEVLYHYRVSANSAQARITAGEFQERWNYYVELARDYTEQADKYAPYKEIFELLTFVKCAIGLTYRTSFLDMRHRRYYITYSRHMLDKLAPGWKKNRELQVRYFYERNLKSNAVAVCSLLYKLRLFELFILIYYFYIKIMKKEVRW